MTIHSSVSALLRLYCSIGIFSSNRCTRLLVCRTTMVHASRQHGRRAFSRERRPVVRLALLLIVAEQGPDTELILLPVRHKPPAQTVHRMCTVCASAPFAMASSASEKTRSRPRFPFWAEGGLSRLKCRSAGLKALAAAAKREPRLTGTCGRGRPRNNSFANSWVY